MAVVLVTAGSIAGLGLYAPAGAAATTTVALYNMNEASGATVLVDSSANKLNGTIGSTVTTHAVNSGATGHRFPYLKPNTPPAVPSHLDSVKDNALLDPGTADYAVTIRYRTTRDFGNIAQKGQAGTAGGYWKFQQPNGIVSCLFRGASGSKSVNSGVALNDGKWHVIRCERTATKVVMTIDGTKKRTGNGATGTISNNQPLSIGGKNKCDQVTITCDYFVGDIDYIRIEKG
jgi:hypothetical protein